MNIIPSVGSTQQIKLKYLFGLNSQIKNNIYCLDDDKILFPGGYHAIIQDLKDNNQQFLSGQLDYTGISCMGLSSCRKRLALGLIGSRIEKDDKIQPPGIEIYDVVTGQRKKPALVFQDPSITKWVSIEFPQTILDANKYLASLSGGDGEVALVYWQWDKCQALCHIKLGQISAYELCFNEKDIDFISIVGKKVYKCFRKTGTTNEGNVTTYAFNSICQQLHGCPQDLIQDFTCHQWLTCENILVAGTKDGHIVVCNENAEFTCVLKNSPIKLKNSKENMSITCITTYPNGFIAATTNLLMFVYKYTHDVDSPFECTHQLAIKTQVDNQIPQHEQITGLAIKPHSSDKIICTLSNNTMYQVRLSKDNDINDPDLQSEQIGLSYHNGTIHAMDICVRKPLIATCSSDKTIKIWNYEEKTLELNWSFTNEEPFALAFHPSGHYIVVAFQDKLRFMSINIHGQSKMDKNRHYKEITQFKNCREIKFSHGGQYFAAVNGSSNAHVIHVFKFYTGENTPQLTFKAHLQKVKGLVWSKDDNILASCGTDGQIYAWKIDNDLKHDQSAMRIIDQHQKSVQFQSLVMTQDCGGCYNDKEQKIIISGNDKNLYDVDMGTGSSTASLSKYPIDLNIQSLSFPTSNKVLFGGIQDEMKSSGAIRCYLYPLANSKHTDYQAHDQRGVEKIKVTPDDKWLVSAGKDGSICLFEIKDKDARGNRLTQGYSKPSQEILVTRQDLDDLKHKKEDQNTKLNEFSNNPPHQKEDDDQIKELNEQLQQCERQHKVEYENSLEQKSEMEKKYEDEINKIQEMNNKEMEELESEMNSKQMQEVEKYENAKRLHNLQISKNNTKKQNILSDQEKQSQQKEVSNQSKLEDLRNQIEKIEHDNNEKEKKNKQSLEQIQNEIKTEIKELTGKNIDEHHTISEQGLKAKTEVSFTNKKISQQKQEMAELEDQRKMYQEQKDDLETKKKELQKEIDQQKTTIIERDKQIGDKERQIYDLKKRSQELEKFKFVLDHKIKELKRDIAPREEEIQRMKVETNRLDGKLKDFNVFNNILGTIVDELDNTQQMMKQDVTKLRQRIQEQKSKVKNFKNQVYVTAQNILNYDLLKQNVISLKEKHSKDYVKSVDIDSDITSEYQSQRKYLEKTVQMLKKNLQKDNEIHKQDNIRIIRENVQLIKQINKLRGEIKTNKVSEKGALQQNQAKNQNQMDEYDLAEKQKILKSIQDEIQIIEDQIQEQQNENEYLKQNLQQ